MTASGDARFVGTVSTAAAEKVRVLSAASPQIASQGAS